MNKPLSFEELKSIQVKKHLKQLSDKIDRHAPSNQIIQTLESLKRIIQAGEQIDFH